jgi:bifunctional UDP-N-acetylglucosamine pyrophosphorylase / glucosamine-1-phosphate N-acetyltransferase
MTGRNRDRVQVLINKGVRILDPEGVDIGEDVNPERISRERVTIYPGCRIYGNDTLIMEGATLGFEGPATVVNCQIGPGVELKGGFFSRSVFLEKASLGSCAQIRDGCILEEESGGAHSVGLKQTILLPFVTLGSLINFCDCLMSGGTSRKDHSEVGSSYIHFNYTPNQDKATPSLIGDVPRGVMLNQPPIFLGGQGGLVGPCRLGFGTVIAAGTICRSDCPEGGKLIFGRERKTGRYDFNPAIYHSIQRRTVSNIIYIGNLYALRQWYLHVRSLFSRGDYLSEELFSGVLDKLDLILAERVKRLGAVAAKLPASIESRRQLGEGEELAAVTTRQRGLHESWPRIEEALKAGRKEQGDSSLRDSFLERIIRGGEERGGSYIATIQGLEPVWAEKGSDWLQGIVDGITRNVLDLLPSFE